MIVLRDNNLELKIKIEGYSYPFAREYWDSNWLSINIEINNDLDNIINYDNSDVALLSTELVNLRDWFLKIEDTHFKEKSEINFMEPCISFKINQEELEVILKYNLNPRYEEDYESVYKLKFIINQKIIEQIIKSLDVDIKKFPERNVNDNNQSINTKNIQDVSSATPYKTLNGKDYTQEEWEKYEQEQWEKYKNKNK